MLQYVIHEEDQLEWLHALLNSAKVCKLALAVQLLKGYANALHWLRDAHWLGWFTQCPVTSAFTEMCSSFFFVCLSQQLLLCPSS